MRFNGREHFWHLRIYFLLDPDVWHEGDAGVLHILLFTVAILGFISLRSRDVVAVSFLFLLPLIMLGGDERDPNIVLQKDSLYNLVMVTKSGGSTCLRLNERAYFHSLVGAGFDSTYLNFFQLGPKLVSAKEVLVLGMGGGASITNLKRAFPELLIDAVEIDPVVVDAGKSFFGIDEVSDLNIYTQDARAFLTDSKKRYDIIEIDLFHGGPYVPFYTSTVEFFQATYDALDDDGLMMMNIYDHSLNRVVTGPYENTILEVFPSVFEIEYGANHIVFAFKHELSKRDLMERLRDIEGNDLRRLADMLTTVEKNPNEMILTDDKAPVESLIYEMLSGP